jgi:hypothetical protein
MSVDGGKITLRFEVDIEDLRRQISAAGIEINKFKQTAEGAGPGLSKLENSTKDLGESATSTAVKFQTLTQGTINLVTSFTQAHTSIGNLARAKTGLQAAAVSVNRAEDALARTQYNLNRALNASTKDYEKIRLLQGRLETQTDALTVAQQRLKNDTDKVRDTYVLFGLNLLNVGFSGIQTAKSMIDLARTMKGVNVTLAITNTLTSKYVLGVLAVIAGLQLLGGLLDAAGVSWGKQIQPLTQITNLMNEFNSATDITIKNYTKGVGDMGDALGDFGRTEEFHLNNSNVRFSKWAIDRLGIISEVKHQQDLLAAAQEQLVGGNFHHPR